MTLQLLHSEFSYLWGKCYFLFYQCRVKSCRSVGDSPPCRLCQRLGEMLLKRYAACSHVNRVAHKFLAFLGGAGRRQRQLCFPPFPGINPIIPRLQYTIERLMIFPGCHYPFVTAYLVVVSYSLMVYSHLRGGRRHSPACGASIRS
jgi:hypothetical protein